MAILSVIKYGHPGLRQVAQPYQPGEVDRQFIEDMIETMRHLDGAGLAATQVNVQKQLCVALEPEKNKIHVLLNPKIIAHSEKMELDSEGCLSLPKLQATVPRHYKVIVRALTPEWEPIEINAKGLFARILQHEIDHLNGVLYIDRADLSTLTWLSIGANKEQTIQAPTNLEEVQREFRRRYHGFDVELQFDPIESR